MQVICKNVSCLALRVFCGTRWLRTMFTRPWNPIISRMNSFCTFTSYFLKTKINLNRSSHLRLRLTNSLFHSGFLTTIFHVRKCATCPTYLSSCWFDKRNDFLWRAQIMMRLAIHLFMFSSCFLSLTSKYSPQHLFTPPSLCVLSVGRGAKFHSVFIE